MKKSKSKIVRNLFILLILLLVMLLLRSCRSFGYDFEISYQSPLGTNAIVVKYDFVSRPSIFKRRFLWDQKIWEYPGSGFMETVTFDVEWLSEDRIRFSYNDYRDQYDEEYIVTISD